MTLFIADVSDHQGIVDWDAYRASGRPGAISKVSEGRSFVADTFVRNREGMAGLVFRGLYHFGRHANDPAADARHFCSLVGSLEAGELPILDAEHTKEDGRFVIGPDAEWCLGFAAEATPRLGVKPALYFSEAYFEDRLGSDPRLAEAFSFYWVAAYRQRPAPSIPGMKLWQSTDGTLGRVRDVPGVAGHRCDDNEFEGTVTELAALAGTVERKELKHMAIISFNGRAFLLSGGVLAQIDRPEQIDQLKAAGIPEITGDQTWASGFPVAVGHP